MTTAFGAITLGSKAAFSDLVGSFVILSTTSYALAIGGHLFSGRKNLPQGPFWMGKWGYPINALSFIFIIFFNIIFCFPYALPVDVPTMNYNSVILGGVAFLTTVWWFVHARRNYPGPKLGVWVENEEGRRLSTVDI
jgi:choline transport protein